MPEFNNNMRQAVMEQPAPPATYEQAQQAVYEQEQIVSQQVAAEADGYQLVAEATGEWTYTGPTTMTKYHKHSLPGLFAVMAFFEVVLALSLLISKGSVRRAMTSSGGKILFFVLFHAFLSVFAAREFWLFHRSKQVVLKHVQRVVPKLGDLERSEAGTTSFNLHFPVVVNGRMQEGKTDFIFDTKNYVDYVDIPQNAGYDEKKGYWVII